MVLCDEHFSYVSPKRELSQNPLLQLSHGCLLCFFASKIRTFSSLMAVSSSSKYWLTWTMGNHWSSYYCWWSPCLILSMGVLYFNRWCPAIFMNNNFLKAVITPNMSIQMIFFVIFFITNFTLKCFLYFEDSWGYKQIVSEHSRTIWRRCCSLKYWIFRETNKPKKYVWIDESKGEV